MQTAGATDEWRRRSERRYRIEFAREREAADLFLLSFPKAGRTWHRLLVGHYLTQVCDQPEQNALELEELIRRCGLRRIVYSHNGANFLDWLPPSNPLVASPSLWRGRPVLLLVRDSRDILISAYHHAKFRSKTFTGSVSDFIREPCLGIAKILTAYHRWYTKRHLAASFDVFSYEMMQRDPGDILARSLGALGIGTVDGCALSKSVEFCRFEKMKSYEQSNFFRSPRLSNSTGDLRANKVREGKIGMFREYLSEADLQFIETATQRVGDPFAHLYV